MTLSFSQKWGDKMGDLNGQPNHFVEKIWNGFMNYFPDSFIDNHFEDYFYNSFYSFSNIVDVAPKIHTLRNDPSNRWHAGRDIHFVINNRTKNRFQFAPVVKCVSVQEIWIYHQQDDNYYPLVNIDNKLLSFESVEKLATNDGFDSVEDFFNYFNKKHFKGKIIHWTDFKY